MNTFINDKVGEIVARDYRAASVFTKFGIDYCCGGQKSIIEACKKGTINPETVVEELNKELSSSLRSGLNFNSWPLDLLADYIEKTHHTYVRSKLDEIHPLLHKLCKVHGSRFPFLHEVRNLFEEVREELLAHMRDEEALLFPLVRMKAKNPEFSIPDQVRSTIENMEREHDVAGNIFKQIALKTHHYSPPENACTTHRVTYAMLKEFEDDLHMHVHLENNILFPGFLTT